MDITTQNIGVDLGKSFRLPNKQLFLMAGMEICNYMVFDLKTRDTYSPVPQDLILLLQLLFELPELSVFEDHFPGSLVQVSFKLINL